MNTYIVWETETGEYALNENNSYLDMISGTSFDCFELNSGDKFEVMAIYDDGISNDSRITQAEVTKSNICIAFPVDSIEFKYSKQPVDWIEACQVLNAKPCD